MAKSIITIITQFSAVGEGAPEKEMATRSSTFAWEISWTEEPGGYRPWCRKVTDMT